MYLSEESSYLVPDLMVVDYPLVPQTSPVTADTALPLGDELLRVMVTASDIQAAESSGLDNPILIALQRQTGSVWSLSDIGLALEVTAPFRTALLCDKAFDHWCHFIATRRMEPFDFMLEIYTAELPPAWQQKLSL